MKKIILILIILIPSLSWGQFNVSVNGGYLASVPFGYDKDMITSAKPDYHAIFGINVGYTINRLTFGIITDIYSVGFKTSIEYTTINATPAVVDNVHQIQSYYGISPNLFVEYKINKLSIGLNTGVLFSNKLKQSLGNPPEGWKKSSIVDYKSVFYSIGIQLSHQININNKFSIIPEISPRFLFGLNDNSSRRYYYADNYFIIPVTVGIKYTF